MSYRDCEIYVSIDESDLCDDSVEKLREIFSEKQFNCLLDGDMEVEVMGIYRSGYSGDHENPPESPYIDDITVRCGRDIPPDMCQKIVESFRAVQNYGNESTPKYIRPLNCSPLSRDCRRAISATTHIDLTEYMSNDFIDDCADKLLNNVQQAF